jgi:hypothetical protein
VDHTDIEQIIGLLDDPSRYQTLAAANHRHTALLDVDGLPAALQRAVDRATALMTDMGSAAPRR